MISICLFQGLGRPFNNFRTSNFGNQGGVDFSGNNRIIGNSGRLNHINTHQSGLGVRSGSTFTRSPNSLSFVGRPVTQRLRAFRESNKEENKKDEIFHKTKLESASGNVASHLFDE